MYVQVGEFRVSWITSTVPVTRFWRNAVFFKNQNARQSENLRVFITPFTLSSLTLFTMSSLYVFSHSICLTLMRPKSINFGSKGTKVTASNSTKSPEKRRKITFSWSQLLLHFWEFQNYQAVISYFCFVNSKFITNWILITSIRF